MTGFDGIPPSGGEGPIGSFYQRDPAWRAYEDYLRWWREQIEAGRNPHWHSPGAPHAALPSTPVPIPIGPPQFPDPPPGWGPPGAPPGGVERIPTFPGGPHGGNVGPGFPDVSPLPDEAESATPRPIDPAGGSQSLSTVGQVAPEHSSLFQTFRPMMSGFAALSFRPQLQVLGYPAYVHNHFADNEQAEAEEVWRPQVLAANAWGAQTDSGAWDYTESPGTSRARGGIAAGGLLLNPPQFEMEDYYGINSVADVDVPTASYFMAAPGVAFAWGRPNTSGGIVDGGFTMKAASNILEVSQFVSGTETTIFSAQVTGGNPFVNFAGTGSARMPTGTTAERPGGPLTGGFRINTDTPASEFFDGSDWRYAADGATFDETKRFYDGSLIESQDIDVIEDGGTVKLQLQKLDGGDLTCKFGGVDYVLDCTPVLELALTAGDDDDPTLNYVYITEAGGSLTLTKSTTSFPAGEFCPVATVLVQSAASVATDGAYKVHSWTDHIHIEAANGHLSHINAKLRAIHAHWTSGVAPSDLVVDDPDAFISTTVGMVFQLHQHDMPAIDMQTPAPVFLVNDPTTAYKRIETFDDITQDAGTGGINNKYMNLVLWGCVSENESECKLFINLPTDTYNVEAAAKNDNEQTAVYAIPDDFVGTGFLIARYTVQAKDSGAWSQSQKVDLRGLHPSSSAGGGGITDHGNLAGIADDDHTQYLLEDGSRAMSGALDMGSQKINNLGAGVADSDALTIAQLAGFLGSYARLDGSGTIFTGHARFDDNIATLFGDGQDAFIFYNGTNLVIKPDLVGSGFVDLAGDLEVAGNHNVAGDYAAGGVVGVTEALSWETAEAGGETLTLTVVSGIITAFTKV